MFVIINVVCFECMCCDVVLCLFVILEYMVTVVTHRHQYCICMFFPLIDQVQTIGCASDDKTS